MDRRYLRRIAEHHAGGPVGRRDAGRRAGRGARHAGGRGRAVPDPGGPGAAHQPRPHAGRAGLAASRPAIPPPPGQGAARRPQLDLLPGRWMNGHSASIPPEGRHVMPCGCTTRTPMPAASSTTPTICATPSAPAPKPCATWASRMPRWCAQCGLMFVVRRIEVDYLRPARLDDSLVVETEVLVGGAASAMLRQTVRGSGGDLRGGWKSRLACVPPNGDKLAGLPPPWRSSAGADADCQRAGGDWRRLPPRWRNRGRRQAGTDAGPGGRHQSAPGDGMGLRGFSRWIEQLMR